MRAGKQDPPQCSMYLLPVFCKFNVLVLCVLVCYHRGCGRGYLCIFWEFKVSSTNCVYTSSNLESQSNHFSPPLGLLWEKQVCGGGNCLDWLSTVIKPFGRSTLFS
jgi:hypothetical protein